MVSDVEAFAADERTPEEGQSDPMGYQLAQEVG
jgi:hypothetical protein